jgi:hypothetical protein
MLKQDDETKNLIPQTNRNVKYHLRPLSKGRDPNWPVLPTCGIMAVTYVAFGVAAGMMDLKADGWRAFDVQLVTLNVLQEESDGESVSGQSADL